MHILVVELSGLDQALDDTHDPIILDLMLPRAHRNVVVSSMITLARLPLGRMQCVLTEGTTLHPDVGAHCVRPSG